MTRKIVTYDILVADNAQELYRLILQRVKQGWRLELAPIYKIGWDAKTRKFNYWYWQAIAKYAPVDK